STCSRRMLATVRGIPDCRRNAAKRSTPSRYPLTVRGLLFWARSARRNERASEVMSPSVLFSAGAMTAMWPLLWKPQLCALAARCFLGRDHAFGPDARTGAKYASVARRGFEPLTSSLKGKRPGPLGDRAGL